MTVAMDSAVVGTVCPGEGRSRHELTDQEVQAVADVVGWWPYHGTLNLRVAAPTLCPTHTPDLETVSGQWWMGWVECVRVGLRRVVILRQRPDRPGVEIVAPLNLRISFGLHDGDVLSFRPHTPNGA